MEPGAAHAAKLGPRQSFGTGRPGQAAGLADSPALLRSDEADRSAHRNSGEPERGMLVARARELARFARQQGYKPDELIRIIEDVS